MQAPQKYRNKQLDCDVIFNWLTYCTIYAHSTEVTKPSPLGDLLIHAAVLSIKAFDHSYRSRSTVQTGASTAVPVVAYVFRREPE